MNFSSFDYFLALARERSYTRAADALHITQQSLSAAVAALELCARRGCVLLPRESGAAAVGRAAARPAGDAAHAGHDGLPHQLRLHKARLPMERAGGLHPHRPRAVSAAGMKTSPGADAPGDVPIYAYLFQGLAGSGSVGSQPRFGLEMSSHGADGFGTGRDEAL